MMERSERTLFTSFMARSTFATRNMRRKLTFLAEAESGDPENITDSKETSTTITSIKPHMDTCPASVTKSEPRCSRKPLATHSSTSSSEKNAAKMKLVALM